MTETDDQERVFAALSDRTRRAMMDRLFEAPGLTLTELVARLPMRRQSASRHLQVLETAGLVTIRWTGRQKHHYLNPLPLAQVQRRWMDKFSQHQANAILDLRDDLEAHPKPNEEPEP